MYNAQKMGWIKKYTFRWLLVSIFIVLCNYGMSQNFSGGLVGGFTTTQVNGDENGGFHRIGPMGGIFAEYHKTKDHHGGQAPHHAGQQQLPGPDHLPRGAAGGA